jgi:hypothetical protein
MDCDDTAGTCQCDPQDCRKNGCYLIRVRRQSAKTRMIAKEMEGRLHKSFRAVTSFLIRTVVK